MRWRHGFEPRGQAQYVYENPTGLNSPVAYRHNGGANVAFFDGHVEWLARNQIDKNFLTTAQSDKLWYAYR